LGTYLEFPRKPFPRAASRADRGINKRGQKKRRLEKVEEKRSTARDEVRAV